MLISEEQLKDLILKTGVVTPEKLEEIIQFAKNSKVNLSDALIEKDIISDENLGILIANFLHIPFIVLSKLSISEQIFHIIPEKTARKHKVIPFALDQDGLRLAMVDQTNVEIQNVIGKKTNF